MTLNPAKPPVSGPAMLQTNVPPSSLTANPKSDGDGMVWPTIGAAMRPPPTTESLGVSLALVNDALVSTVTAQSVDNTQPRVKGWFNSMATPLEDARFKLAALGVSQQVGGENALMLRPERPRRRPAALRKATATSDRTRPVVK